jgi:hypothetical protein
MKRKFWINRLIFTAIILFLATDCIKDEAIKSGQLFPCFTQQATNVSLKIATLNGAVNPKDSSTTVVFEYGIATSYGQEVTYEQNPITGDTIKNVYADISELTAGTTYHFRVKAENSLGVVYGKDMAFTTLSNAPPTVNTYGATNITDTTATLNGDVNANNRSSVVTFEYGTTTSYGQEVTAEQSPATGDTITIVSATVTGLTCSTKCHFRIKAANSLGVVYGGDKTLKTERKPTLTTDSVTSVTDTTAVIEGNITDDGCADVTARGVYFAANIQGLDNHNGPHTYEGAGTGSFTSKLAGLKPSTTYYVQAYATNRNGKGFGNIISFRTSP